jgi:hypothetical protein
MLFKVPFRLLFSFPFRLSAIFCLILTMPLAGAEAKPADDELADPKPQIIRKLLITALDSKKTTDSLYTSLSSVKSPSALTNAYMGTLEALKAKHAWNPYYKIKYLNDCQKTFKAAVTRDPHNIEIRFMRFSIEHNVPGFLGYTKNLEADKNEIIKQLGNKHYAQADEALVKTIIDFLIESKRCTAAETHSLKQYLAAL